MEKHEQGGYLDDVDRQADRRRSSYPSVRDISNPEGEHDRNQHHEHRAGIRGAHEVRIQSADDVAAKDSRDSDHHAWVYALRNSCLTCAPGSALDSGLIPGCCAHMFRLDINNSDAMRPSSSPSKCRRSRLYFGGFDTGEVLL